MQESLPVVVPISVVKHGMVHAPHYSVKAELFQICKVNPQTCLDAFLYDSTRNTYLTRNRSCTPLKTKTGTTSSLLDGMPVKGTLLICGVRETKSFLHRMGDTHPLSPPSEDPLPCRGVLCVANVCPARVVVVGSVFGSGHEMGTGHSSDPLVLWKTMRLNMCL